MRFLADARLCANGSALDRAFARALAYPGLSGSLNPAPYIGYNPPFLHPGTPGHETAAFALRVYRVDRS